MSDDSKVPPLAKYLASNEKRERDKVGNIVARGDLNPPLISLRR